MRGLLVALLFLAPASALIRTHNVDASTSVSVSNSLLGCEANPTNLTVEFLENGERQYGLLKFNLQDLAPPNTEPDKVVLHLYLVEGTRPMDLSGRLEVVVVRNNWDAESVTCDTMPEPIPELQPRLMSGYYTDPAFLLDITNEIQHTLASGVHVLSLMIRPEADSGTVYVDFGSTMDYHQTLKVSPLLVVRDKDILKSEPELRTSGKTTVTAGESYQLELRIPRNEMNKTKYGNYIVPDGSLAIRVRYGELGDGDEIPFRMTQTRGEPTDTYISFSLKFAPTRAGPIAISGLWNNAKIEGSLVIVNCVAGPTNPSKCSSDITEPSFFDNHKLPRVGETTCFKVTTRDSYGNLAELSQTMAIEILAGVDDKSCYHKITQISQGVNSVCFQPADADMVSISVKTSDDDVVFFPGFPLEVDCLPGDIVPSKTKVLSENLHETIAGTWGELKMITYDEADHVSNIDMNKTKVKFSGPGDVQSNISLVGEPMPQSGESILYFQASLAGYYTVEIYLSHVKLGPFNITILPNVPVATQAKIIRSIFPSIAGQQNSFDIDSYDSFGNRVAYGGLEFEVEITPTSSSHEDIAVDIEVVDSEDGSYTVTWMAETADTYQVVVRHASTVEEILDSIDGSPFVAKVLAGPMSLRNSGLGNSTMTELQAGRDPQFVIQERDAFDNDRDTDDLSYVWSASLTNEETGEMVPVVISSTNTGQHVLVMDVSVVSSFLLVIKANESDIDQIRFQTVAGPACPLTTLVMHLPSPGIVGHAVEFVVQTRDTYGNSLIAGGGARNLRVDAVHAGLPSLSGIVNDLNNGSYSVSFTPFTTGSYSIFVYWKENAVGDSPYEIKVIADSAVARTSYVAGTALHSGVAGEDGYVMVRSRDSGGNDVELGGSVVAGSMQRHADLVSESTQEFDLVFTDNQDGTYSGTYNASVAGDYSLFVRVDSEDVLGSPFAVKVAPNVISSLTRMHTSKLVEESPRAGERIAIKIEAVDQFANFRLVGGDEMIVTYTHTESGHEFPAIVDDLSNGTYVATVLLTTSGNYRVEGKTRGGVIFEKATGGFEFILVPGPGSPDHSSIDGAQPLSAVAGQETFVWLTLRDVYYNDAIVGGANIAVSFLPSIRTSRFIEDVPVSITDSNNGTYVVRFTATVSMLYTLKVRLVQPGGESDVKNSPLTVDVAPTIASGEMSRITGSANSITAGSAIHFVLHARDMYNNSLRNGGDHVFASLSETNNGTVVGEVRDQGRGVYYFKFIPTKSGAYRIIASINEEEIPTPANTSVIVHADVPEASYTRAAWASLNNIEAGVVTSFDLFPADKYGNPADASATNWAVSVISDVESTTGNVSQGSDVLIAPTRSGTALVFVKAKNQNIVGSPHEVKIVGSWTNARKTQAYDIGLKNAIAGQASSFRVRPMDQYGNPSTKGPINVEVLNPDGFSIVVRTQELDDAYNITYTPVNTGRYRVDVMVENLHIFGSPYKLLVKPGPTSAMRSQAFGGGLTQVTGGSTAYFTIIAKDSMGNLRQIGGDAVACSGQIRYGPPLVFNVEDKQTGEYLVSYDVPSTNIEMAATISVYINSGLVATRNHTISITNETYVYTCPENCNDPHGVCDTSTGLCHCSNQYIGPSCETKYLRCQANCNNRGDCDFLTGACHCEGGYSGDACEIDPSGTATYIHDVTEVSLKVKHPSVIPPKCYLKCSGNGICVYGTNNKTDTCVCTPGYVGEGCELRTYFELIQADFGYVMIYEISTGKMTMIQQGMTEDKSCAGMNHMSTPSSITRPAQRKYVNLGSLEMLELDPITNIVTLLTFDKDAIAKGVLHAPKVHSLGVLNLFKGQKATYLGMNRMMLSTEYNSTLYRIYRSGDSVKLTVESLHTWRSNARGMMYAGHDLIGRYNTNGTVDLYKLDREATSIREQIQASTSLPSIHDINANSMSLHAMQSDVWFAFDYKTSDYISYLCPTDEHGRFSGCTYLNNGNVKSGYRCSESNNNLPCSNATKVECLKSQKCGFCFASNQCLDGDERGPEQGTCSSGSGESAWIFSTNDFSYVYRDMGHSHAMSFEPATSKYIVWNIEQENANPHCRILESKVASGYLHNSNHHNVLFVGLDILDFDPATGKFRIGTCDHSVYQLTGMLHCDTWTQGTWPLLRDRKLSVLRVSDGIHPSLLIDHDVGTGDYRVWSLGSRSDLDNGVPLMSGSPVSSGTFSTLIATDITLMGDIVLAHQSITSTTAFFKVSDSDQLIELAEPVSKGIKTVVVDGKKQLLQYRYASMGNNTLLQYGPLGYWKYLQCYPYPVKNDVFGVISPIHCQPKSAGSPAPPMCASKISEDECTAHPACGWCASKTKCYNGWKGGLCSKTEAKCPAESWKFIGGRDGSGFIGGVNELPSEAVEPHDCSHSTSCKTCVADLECGWHTPTGTCVAGGPSGPGNTQDYPIDSKSSDWSYFYCSGSSSCEQVQTCKDCSALTYCGWCEGARKCMTGTAASPLFEGCSAGYDFSSQSCSAVL